MLAPPPIQGIGKAGGFQMQVELLGGSFDYQKLDELTRQIVKEASSDPTLQHVLTTFQPSAPQVASRSTATARKRCRSRSAMSSRR